MAHSDSSDSLSVSYPVYPLSDGLDDPLSRYDPSGHASSSYSSRRGDKVAASSSTASSSSAASFRDSDRSYIDSADDDSYRSRSPTSVDIARMTTRDDPMGIDLEELPDCGLIFISTEDPTALVAKAITKQNYSTIGFFYKTDISGRIEVKVILVDVYRFTIPNWLGQGASLNDLLQNPLVSGVAIKGLRSIFDDDGEIDEEKTKELCSEFRQAIALVMRNGTETSLREIISQLFGYPVKEPTTGVTAIEMVNRVIDSIDRQDQIPQDGSLSAEAIESLKGPDVLGADIESKGRLMQILASNFNQQEVSDPSVANKLIQAYIVENDLFDDLHIIPLPSRDPNLVRKAQEATAILQSEYMAAAVGQFVKMIIDDQGFYQTVVTGFNETRMLTRKKETDFKRSLLELADDSTELSELLLSWINHGEVNYTELLSLISKIDDTKETVGERHRLYIGERSRLPIIDQSRLLLLRKDKDKCSDPRFLVGSYLALYDQMRQILLDVRRSEDDPVIDLNQIIENVNDMGTALGLGVDPLRPIPGEYSCRGIINVTGMYSPCVPLVLKCGTCISIPLHNPDLGDFDRQTLIEILEALDVTASTDQRFNVLRRQIATRLASFPSRH